MEAWAGGWAADGGGKGGIRATAEAMADSVRWLQSCGPLGEHGGQDLSREGPGRATHGLAARSRQRQRRMSAKNNPRCMRSARRQPSAASHPTAAGYRAAGQARGVLTPWCSSAVCLRAALGAMRWRWLGASPGEGLRRALIWTHAATAPGLWLPWAAATTLLDHRSRRPDPQRPLARLITREAGGWQPSRRGRGLRAAR